MKHDLKLHLFNGMIIGDIKLFFLKKTYYTYCFYSTVNAQYNKVKLMNSVKIHKNIYAKYNVIKTN